MAVETANINSDAGWRGVTALSCGGLLHLDADHLRGGLNVKARRAAVQTY
jgi:hypothetical protein